MPLLDGARARLLVLLSALFFVASPAAAQSGDSDGDGTPDASDNCIQHANGPSAPDAGGHVQRDTNLEGYGNRCDPDYNDDGIVGGPDFLLLGQGYGKSQGDPGFDPELDGDGDGTVGAGDLAILQAFFARPPGPSGHACAGSPPCPPPAVSIGSPADGAVTTAASVTVSGTVAPPVRRLPSRAWPPR